MTPSTPSETGSELAWAYDHCAELVREGDRDRFLAAFFAPADKRPHLHALYAFSLEVARVREVVSDPMPGDVRLQWWRDALTGTGHGAVRAHPVAAALLATVERFRLPKQALIDLVDARVFDLYDDPMPTRGDLEGYCGETSSALMRLASLILTGGEEPGGADAVGHGGVAYAFAGLLRALPWHAARGQLYVPKELLERYGVTRDDVVTGRGGPGFAAALADLRAAAREHLAQALAGASALQGAARAALLPLALVPGYLQRMERGDYDPFRTVVDTAQWRKQWALWRMSRRLG